jgi:hypothetical protein
MFKNNIFTGNVTLKKWAEKAAVRAAKTFAQTAVALLPASVSIDAVNWTTVLGTAALAAVGSILTSMAGLPEVDSETDDEESEEDDD